MDMLVALPVADCERCHGSTSQSAVDLNPESVSTASLIELFHTTSVDSVAVEVSPLDGVAPLCERRHAQNNLETDSGSH